MDKIKRIAQVFPVKHVTLRTPHSRYIGMLMIPVKNLPKRGSRSECLEKCEGF